MTSKQDFELSRAQRKLSAVENGVSTLSERDEVDMILLGKNQVLKRNRGFISTLGLNCSMMATWQAVLLMFTTGLENGGPAGIIWGYLIVWLGVTCTFFTMAELSSMAPASSGEFHWVALLAPESSRQFLSFFTGCITAVGWQAVTTACAYEVGSLIDGLFNLVWPDHLDMSWRVWLLLWAVMLVAVLVNTVIGAQLPRLEIAFLILQGLGFLVTIIPLVFTGSHQSASYVFTSFANDGGWSSQSLSFWVGIVGNVFAFLGPDAAIHISEEIRNASVVVPYSLLASIILSGSMGLGMLLAILFCLGDSHAALSSPTGFPFIEIYLQATNSTAGTAAIIVVMILTLMCGVISCLTAASRMVWSFARDHGLPGWRILHQVHPRTAVPDIAVAVTTAIACALGLINIGSTTVFCSVVSLSINALYLPYLISSVLLLWRRCTGGIALPTSHAVDNPKLVWGPWRVPGLLGVLINIIGVAFQIVILLFSFWPATTPVSPGDMNYSVVVLAVVVIGCIVYYFITAHKTYSGPLVERTE